MLKPRSLLCALALLVLAGTARADVFTDHPLTSDVVPFDATRPVVVLVHGWDPEPGQMDPLGVELGRRGYSVVRWHWDWLANMEKSAEAFARGMQQLIAEQRLPELRIFTHSQGSLIARRALTTERAVTLAGSVPIRLISLAAPFGGFLSANGTYTMPWNIFGIKESHRQLRSWSRFIRRPGTLGSNASHVKIDTNEPGKTRINNGVVEDDSRLKPRNERQKVVDAAVLRRYELQLGHAGPLRDDGRLRPELVAILDLELPRLGVVSGLTAGLTTP